jgi:hypothetical protein
MKMRKKTDKSTEYRIMQAQRRKMGGSLAVYRKVSDDEYSKYYQNDIRIITLSGTRWLYLFALDSIEDCVNIVSGFNGVIVNVDNLDVC